MSLPLEISSLLKKHKGEFTDRPCEGAKFHSPRPLDVHAYQTKNNKTFYLCGTCRDNLNVYLFLWNKEKGLDWPTMRLFGNQLRSIGMLVLEGRRRAHD